MDDYPIKLATSFAEAIGRHSYDWASTKMTQAREKKKAEEQQVVYEEIINSLLQDKSDLEFVARQYKTLYENITISDEDIEYLQQTMEKVAELLIPMSSTGSNQQESIDVLINLINKDTLKTMQLLGFNYKEAIGEPLTEVCASAIHKHLGGKDKPKNTRKK